MAMSDPGSDMALQLEVVGLVQELTAEALGKNLTNGNGIYKCFAAYLQKKMEDRDASERVFAKAAWSDETRIIRELHQTASLSDSQSLSASQSTSALRPESSPALQTHRASAPPTAPDVRINMKGDSDESDFSDSSESLSLSSDHETIRSPGEGSLCASPDHTSQMGYNLLGSRDRLGTAKSGIERGVPQRTECSPNIIKVEQHGSTKSGEDINKPISYEPFQDGHEKVEDLCTFAFFSSTVEDISKPKPESTDEGDGERCLTSESDTGSASGNEYDLLIMELQGHKAAVTQCCLMEKLVLTSSRDGTLKIWSQKSGVLLRTLNLKRPVHEFRVLTRTQGCLHVIIGCEDGALVLMKVIAKSLDFDVDVDVTLGGEYSGHLPNPIRAMAISPNGHFLATGCCFLMNQIKLNKIPVLTCRGTLKTWNLDSMVSASEQGKFYDGAPLQIKTMKQLVSNCFTKTTCLKPNKKRRDNKEEAAHGIRALAYTPDGTMIVAGFGQPEDLAVVDVQMLVIVNAENLHTLWSEGSHLCQINDIHFLPAKPDDAFSMVVSSQSSTFMATITEAGSAKVNVEYQWTEPVSEYLLNTTVAPKGDLSVSCYKFSLRFRSTHNGEEVYRIHMAHRMPTTSVCFSQGGEMVCSGASDGSIRIWSTPKPPKIQRLDLLARKRTTAPSASGSRTLPR